MTRGMGSILAAALALAACSADDAAAPTAPEEPPSSEGVFCSISQDDLTFFAPPDAIPALSNPPLVAPDHPDAAYLEDSDRVVGLLLEGEPVAVPLNILRYHESVNLDAGALRVAVTYCPLTGSALIFDRAGVDGSELGVSGLIMRNNLVLFNREGEASFFVQMRRGPAQCGPMARAGRGLEALASWELRWDAWRALHPGTTVVSDQTGFGRRYDINPNEDYERLNDHSLQVEVPIDPRRPPKERVLGIPAGFDGGWAFPFEALKSRARLAMELDQKGRPAVVFWDRAAEAALPFFREVEGEVLSFRPVDGGYEDTTTGSLWRLDGLAVSGPLAGRRLEPITEAYVAFWFAWADFHPETGILTP